MNVSKNAKTSVKATYLLIALTAAGLLWQLVMPQDIIKFYVLSRENFVSAAYVLLTYGFLHSGLSHFGVNMLSLFIQGKILEKNVGSMRMAAVYLFGILGGGASYLIFNPENTVIGASAATSAVMAANIAIAPGRSLVDEIPLLRRFPLPGLRSFLNVSLWAAVSILVNIQMTFEGAGSTATIAHLGGMLSGLVSVFVLSDKATKKGLFITAGLITALVGVSILEPGATLSYISLAALVILTMLVRRSRRFHSV